MRSIFVKVLYLVRPSIPYSSGPPVAGIDGPLGGTGFVTVYYGAGCPRP
jgi:hypothetical protein